MRFGLISFCALMVFSGAATAQENAIRVVNPDGSVSVFELPANNPPVKAAPREPVRVREVVVPETAAPVAAPQPAAEPAPVAEEPVKQPKPVATKTIAYKKSEGLPPLPARKPAAPPRPAAAAPYEPPPPPPGPLTRDRARRIALEVAPPATRADVLPTVFKDRPAFIVRFKTEDGPYDVVVDAENGDILQK